MGMSVTYWIIAALLAILVICCWIGAAGAWRMPEPMQSLQYLGVLAVGGIFLAVAVLIQTGWSSAFIKTTLIAAIFVVTNSVGAHAAARAIRTRQHGHWEPDPDAGERPEKGHES